MSRDTFSGSALWPLSCPMWNLLSRYWRWFSLKRVAFFLPFRAQPCKYLYNSSKLDRRVAIKPTLKRCHVTCAMLEGTTVSGASTWKSSWLHSRFNSRTAAKLNHAVTAQSGHDSIDDNDSQAAQDQAAYSSVRLAVPHQCELLHPTVYDTLNICPWYSSNKLTKLSVAQLRLICSCVLQHPWMDIELQQSKRKAPSFTLLLSQIL